MEGLCFKLQDVGAIMHFVDSQNCKMVDVGKDFVDSQFQDGGCWKGSCRFSISSWWM
jgi:hypothetical protein